MLRELIDVSGKLLCHIQKGNDDVNAEGKPRDAEVCGAGSDKQTTDRRANDIENISDVHDNRAERIGISVGAEPILIQLLVNFVKILFGLFFVAENLDDLLSVHHFLHKAFCLSDGFLLADEIFGRAASDPLGNENHGDNAKQNNQRHPNTVPKHNAKHREYNDAGLEQARKRL